MANQNNTVNGKELYSEIAVTKETGMELGLTAAEYDMICEKIGRTPTYTEVGMYSVMWSEHCSYKNSILQLKTLPRSGANMLVEAGEENAGLVDIGDGYAVCFKIESHNHPSAIEPYQGAATGVGGILRDIFTMGARPIAALNSLRFGSLDTPRTRYLLSGVVKGIGDYGNSFGVPTVGGEVFFETCYTDNPLVNAMAVGIVRTDKTASATATGVGNPVMYLGSGTGRDGIHGASMASKEFEENAEDMRPTVQVGDPFAEKVLLEATLELIDAGVIVGIQDMGAAGICCSTSEMSAKDGAGMEVNLDLVPLREADMSAYEIMLSESQERMLAVVEKGKEDIAKAICDKWDVPIVQIGTVTDTGVINAYRNGELCVSLPAESLVLGGGAPVYEREWKEASYFADTSSVDTNALKTDVANDKAFWILLSSPTIASKRWVYEQYDSHVRTNTVQTSGSDAAVTRIKEIPGKALASATDCNSRYVYLNPYRGGLIAVAESARNVVCSGARPVAITNCLNFGNPYDPEVYWQFKEAIRGMGDACRKFDTPVTGGNVSFHNESQNHAIYPTPTIGMLGVIDDVTKVLTAGFKNEGDQVYVLGENKRELGGSEYVRRIHDKVVGQTPELNLDTEHALYQAILECADKQLLQSAHDCSEGGVAIAIAEKCVIGEQAIGANIRGIGTDAADFFGESQSRVVVSVSPDNASSFESVCAAHNVPCTNVGTVGGDTLIIENLLSASVEEVSKTYYETLPGIMAS